MPKMPTETREDRFARGAFQGGVPPYGYRRTHGRGTPLEPELREAQRVRWFFGEYLKQGSLARLERALAGTALRTRRGNRWTGSALRDLLTNPVCVGKVRLAGVIAQGTHKPIIDMSVYAAVQEKLARNLKRAPEVHQLRARRGVERKRDAVAEEVAELLAIVRRRADGIVTMPESPAVPDPSARLLARARAWLLTSPLSPTTLERYVCTLGKLVRWGIGTVGALDARAVQRFLWERQQGGLTVASCNRDLTSVCALARWLVRAGELAREVLLELRDLYQEEPVPSVIEWLTADEIAALRRAAMQIDPALDVAIALAVGGGFRFGELRRLRHEDLVLDAEFPFARVMRTHGRRIKRNRQRTTPLPKSLADELLARGIGAGAGPGWLFPARRPSSRRACVAERTLQVALAEAGARIGRHVTWVLLRHTFASLHAQAGVSLAKVARWMGNSVLVCERHYAGLAPGGDPEAERARAFSGTAPVDPDDDIEAQWRDIGRDTADSADTARATSSALGIQPSAARADLARRAPPRRGGRPPRSNGTGRRSRERALSRERVLELELSRVRSPGPRSDEGNVR